MANQNPIVTITMENGDVMKAELYPEIAPNTVNNFISLINKGFYDGVVFHRIIPGFMIQGGDPEGTGMKQYLLAALFNAPTTMQLYYQNKVNHDLAARR